MIKALLAFSIIPLVGFLISLSILNNLAEDIPVSVLIENVKYNCSIEYQEVCSTFNNIFLLRDASIYSGIASFLIVFLYFFVARLAGTNRQAISRLFPPLIPIVLLMISIQTLVQGAIITYGAYIGEVFLIGRVHYILIGLIGIGAAIGALNIISSIFSLTKKLVHTQMAYQLLPSEQPRIWDFVNKIADEINSTPPDNIIVGIEPTFYATAADVEGCADGKLRGETLYLSLPLMRLFNISELKAVIGHELGHFRAKDTEYSTKFSPVYRGLGNSIHSLGGSDGGALDLAKLPALLVLSSMFNSFDESVASISREREFEADKVGVSVSSPKDLAHALFKVILFSSVWTGIRQDNVRRLNKGKVSPNLSLTFKDSAAFNSSTANLKYAKDTILTSTVAHPTDSHPLLQDRLENIGFNEREIKMVDVLLQGESSSDLIGDLEKIEENLTEIEHRLMISSGYAVIPEESSEDSGLEQLLYIMAAGMVGADGKIEQQEIAIAEQIGMQLVEAFDKTDFREYINNLDAIPNILDVGKDLLSLEDDAKKTILSYLEAIAKADGEFAKEEIIMLNDLKAIWEIN